MSILRSPSFAGKSSFVISIENNCLRMLEVRGNRIFRWDSYPLPAGVVQEGSVADIKQLQAGLSEFIQKEKLDKSSSICFPSNRVLFRTVILPRIKKKLLPEVIDREARRELPVSIEDLHLFSHTYFKTKEAQSVLLVGVQKEPFDRFYHAVNDAALKPRRWQLKPLALARAVGLANVVILDVQQNSADLVLVAKGAPELVRSLVMPAGLNMDERAVTLAREIDQSVEYFKSNEGETSWDPATPLVITGPLATDPALVDKMKALSVLPLKSFVCPFTAPESFHSETYASTIGAALIGRRRPRKKSATSVDFSVLPAQYQPKPFPVRQAAAIAGVAIGALLILPVYQAQAGNSERIEQSRAELARVQRQTTFARTNLNKRSQMQLKIEEILGMTSELKKERDQIFASQLHVSEDLLAAAVNLTLDVSLKKISIKGNSVTVEGDATSDYAVFRYVRALEKTARFPGIIITSMDSSTVNGADVTGFALYMDRKNS